MASTTMAVTASSIAVAPQQTSASGLSSASRVCVNALPVRVQSQIAARRPLAVRASVEETPLMQKVVKSVVAASAVAALLSGGGNVLAAVGPGTDGAERTAQKADDLLTQADKLVTDDSPERFGPGRVPGGDKSSVLSQQGGSGVKPSVQGTSTTLSEGADKASDLLGQAKSGASDVASNAESAADKGKGFFGGLFSSFGK